MRFSSDDKRRRPRIWRQRCTNFLILTSKRHKHTTWLRETPPPVLKGSYCYTWVSLPRCSSSLVLQPALADPQKHSEVHGLCLKYASTAGKICKKKKNPICQGASSTKTRACVALYFNAHIFRAHNYNFERLKYILRAQNRFGAPYMGVHVMPFAHRQNWPIGEFVEVHSDWLSSHQWNCGQYVIDRGLHSPAYSCGSMGRSMTLWNAAIQSFWSSSVSQAKRNFLSGVTMVTPYGQWLPCTFWGRPCSTV